MAAHLNHSAGRHDYKKLHIIHATPKIIAVATPSLIETSFISLSVDFE